jgi:FtsP/CotA-like multicopper oxidase with cupredoxin domain
MSLSRRSLLKLGAVGAGATAAGLVLPLGQSASTSDWVSSLPASRMPKPYARRLALPPSLPYREMADADGPYRLYTVTQRGGWMNIIDDLPTPAYGYGYVDVQGNQQFSVPGPVVRVPRGTRVKLRVKNDLPAAHAQWGYSMSTSTHLHGSASLPQYDGYADDLTQPGAYKDYWYPNVQSARTLWYHDHGVHHTAQAVYSGLAAQYHLHDEAERALLPQGRYDVPLTISDALFDTAGRLVYQDNQFSGVWGDVILVNGTPWPFLEVQRRTYRFRILMATLSRSMNLRLVNVQTRQAVPVHIVATDGGLVPLSQQVTSWRHAGAERYEILVDFGAFGSLPAGSTFELRNTSARNNRDYLHTGKVMQFRLSDAPVEDWTNSTVPERW